MGQIPFGLKLVRHKSRPFPVVSRGFSVDSLTICIVGFHSPGGSVLFYSSLCAVNACGSSLPHPAGAHLFSTCQLLTNHYEQCWKYYCLPSGWGSYGLAVEEELHLTEKLFWGIFDSLSHKVMAVLLEQRGG